MEKLYPSKKKMTLVSIIAFLIGAVVIFFPCFKLFTTFPWTWAPYTIIFLYIAVVIFFYILAIKKYYYVIEGKELIIYRFTKEIAINFKDIVYIENRKKPTQTFGICTGKGNVIYIMPDKNDIVYQTIIDKSKNILNEEEFKKRYPNIKL